ncbi:hypothetical protein ACIQRC_34090 [Streptomyces californicus]|uniref:hypothetical protein n=1 Tax=Streptomyces californicus TaxID=67351 RepID=UPI00382DDD30
MEEFPPSERDQVGEFLRAIIVFSQGRRQPTALARAAEPPPGTTAGTQVSRQSLLADVANLTARNSRLSVHIARLERRLSETLGQAAWEASGLGAPADVETLTRRVTELEQQILDLRAELTERDEDLAAARAANRELMTQVNR